MERSEEVGEVSVLLQNSCDNKESKNLHFEDHADETALEILTYLGKPLDSYVSFFMTRECDLSREPEYGDLSDDHHSGCWRAYRNKKGIEPKTRNLLLDDRVEVGDYVEIEFKAPLIKNRPTTTGTAAGFIIGTKMMIDIESQEPRMFYFIINSGKESMDTVISFTAENIEYDGSRVYKKSNYKTSPSLH